MKLKITVAAILLVTGLRVGCRADVDEFLATLDYAHDTFAHLKSLEKKPAVTLTSVSKRKPGVEERRSRRSLKKTPAPQDLTPIIESAADKYGITPNFIRAVIAVESNYDVRALSHKGAMGLMQLMPDTAELLRVENPWSPQENVEGGTKYLYSLLREFQDPRKALIAYNAGPEVVRQEGRVPAETRRYVSRVTKEFRRIEGQRKEARR